MDFFNNFLHFPFKSEVEAHLIFGMWSAVIGLLVIALDFSHYRIKKKSFLSLTYIGINSIWVFIFWGMGAGIVGFLGGIISILQENLQTCVSVGVGWPLIVPRIIEAKTLGEDIQQQTTELKENN